MLVYEDLPIIEEEAKLSNRSPIIYQSNYYCEFIIWLASISWGIMEITSLLIHHYNGTPQGYNFYLISMSIDIFLHFLSMFGIGILFYQNWKHHTLHEFKNHLKKYWLLFIFLGLSKISFIILWSILLHFDIFSRLIIIVNGLIGLIGCIYVGYKCKKNN